jgi:hypothetical protein
MWTSPDESTSLDATTGSSITIRSIPLKQNSDVLFTGHEQGLTLTSEPIDLAALLFSKAGKVEYIA